jgi:hypothetical protein
MATEKTNRVFRNFALRKGLAVLVLVVAVGVLPACFIETSGPTPPACNAAPAVGVTWFIMKAGTNAQLSCAQAAASTVTLSLNGTNFDFNCDVGEGVTTQLAPGSYSAQLTLFGINGQVLSTTQSMPVAVGSCGVTDLGDVPFTVN